MPETGPALLGQAFDVVDIQRWDTPAVHIPDRAGLALYLRGRGLAEEHAHSSAAPGHADDHHQARHDRLGSQGSPLVCRD